MQRRKKKKTRIKGGKAGMQPGGAVGKVWVQGKSQGRHRHRWQVHAGM